MTKDVLSERLSLKGRSVTPTTRRVAEFIQQNRLVVVAKSAQELAHAMGTSDASVIRSVQALGFEGLPELRQAIVESFDQPTSPARAMRRTLSDIGDSADAAVASVVATHLENIQALQSAASRRAMVAATKVLHPLTRIAVFANGPSLGLADYVRRMLVRQGRQAIDIGATGNAFADRLMELQPGDGLLMLAYGKLYREASVLLDVAERLSIPVVLVTDMPDSDVVGRVSALVPAHRGRTDHVALHAAMLASLEAIALALAAADRAKSLGSLERLSEYRQLLAEPDTPPVTRTKARRAANRI